MSRLRARVIDAIAAERGRNPDAMQAANVRSSRAASSSPMAITSRLLNDEGVAEVVRRS